MKVNYKPEERLPLALREKLLHIDSERAPNLEAQIFTFKWELDMLIFIEIS